jgi:hypothetical protein
MTQSSVPDSTREKEARLPRLDWLVLPVLSLLTIGILACSTELVARRVFWTGFKGQDDCLVLNDPSTGVRGIPNSVCRDKFPEGQPVEYRFNSCGHRASMDCGPKPPDTYRIVMTGTSMSMGLGIPIEETFGSLLPTELWRRTGRKVELYNESISLESPRSLALNFKDILAAKPDMILWTVTYWDIKNASLVLPRDEISGQESPRVPANGAPASVAPSISSTKTRFIENVEFAARSAQDAARKRWHDTRADTMLNDFMYAIESQRDYLLRCNIWHDDLGYLGAKPGPIRLHHLQEFDTYAAMIEARAKAANVPLVVVYLPGRSQAALISMGEWPASIDPYSLDNDLRSIVVSRGGTYIDILPYYRNIPNPEDGYFPVNGHLNVSGHATVSSLLARQLTSGTIPALKAAP